MAKIVITNQRSTPASQNTENGRNIDPALAIGSAARAVARSTGRQVHFLDVWGDLPPTGKTAGMSIVALSPTPHDAPGPVGPAISRYQSLKSALISWGLIIG